MVSFDILKCKCVFRNADTTLETILNNKVGGGIGPALCCHWGGIGDTVPTTAFKFPHHFAHFHRPKSDHPLSTSNDLIEGGHFWDRGNVRNNSVIKGPWLFRIVLLLEEKEEEEEKTKKKKRIKAPHHAPVRACITIIWLQW